VPELILMRHAEAVAAASGGNDFDRALSGHGRREGKRSARELAQGVTPGVHVLYSPALRTRETAAIVAKELALSADAMTAVPELYAASAHTIRAVVQRHAQAATLLVIGHNPGISELGQKLSGAHRHLATAAYWRLRFDEAGWRALMRA
jgi:phosphohistidine phosphatase